MKTLLSGIALLTFVLAGSPSRASQLNEIPCQGLLDATAEAVSPAGVPYLIIIDPLRLGLPLKGKVTYDDYDQMIARFNDCYEKLRDVNAAAIYGKRRDLAVHSKSNRIARDKTEAEESAERERIEKDRRAELEKLAAEKKANEEAEAKQKAAEAIQIVDACRALLRNVVEENIYGTRIPKVRDTSKIDGVKSSWLDWTRDDFGVVSIVLGKCEKDDPDNYEKYRKLSDEALQVYGTIETTVIETTVRDYVARKKTAAEVQARNLADQARRNDTIKKLAAKHNAVTDISSLYKNPYAYKNKMILFEGFYYIKNIGPIEALITPGGGSGVIQLDTSRDLSKSPHVTCVVKGLGTTMINESNAFTTRESEIPHVKEIECLSK